MYFIYLYNNLNTYKELLIKVDKPEYAYELAHEFDAMCNIGYDCEDEYSGKRDSACIITIEDHYGNSLWHECCSARCPSPKGLFQ